MCDGANCARGEDEFYDSSRRELSKRAAAVTAHEHFMVLDSDGRAIRDRPGELIARAEVAEQFQVSALFGDPLRATLCRRSPTNSWRTTSFRFRHELWLGRRATPPSGCAGEQAKLCRTHSSLRFAENMKLAKLECLRARHNER